MARNGISKNLARLNADLRRELIEIIAGMKDPRLQTGLVTVTRVEAAQDLSSAKIYISVLNEEAGAANAVVAALERAKGHVRSEIAARMHIRRAPECFFIADDSAAYADHINQMLRNLD